MSESTYAPTALTVRDYLALPDDGPRYQLVEGELHMAPSPELFHQDIVLNIARILGNYLEQNPIGKVMVAPLDVFLTKTNVFQPDVIYVAKERFHLLRRNGIHGGPDLAIEILSPSTARLDRGPKKRVYARCEVTELWLVSPEKRSVAVYDLRQSETEPAATWREGETFACRHFPGLELPVAKFFAR